jgi:hypothetical protein
MTMNKEFVTYEQASELKKLLYGEHYGDDYLAWYASNKDFHYRNMNSPVYPNNQSFIAPLKQQAFAWFRDKYNLSAYITDRLHCVHERESWKCVIDDMFYPLMTYDTYEEAENACIDKLIELAKEKGNG